jgi:PAS domain S-box-containing protein
VTARIAAEFAVFEPYYGALAVSVALALAVASTYSAWNFASRTAWNEARLRFDFRASQIGDAVHGRVANYEQVLRGTVGLLTASQSAEGREWRTYVRQAGIEQRYPGIQGIGFASPRAPGQPPLQSDRAAGDGGGSEYPRTGTGAPLRPVNHVDAFEGRDLGTRGVDVLSDATGRAAMEQARDSGMPALSGKVTLDMGPGGDPQTGVLFLVPVFGQGTELTTVANQDARATGYAYAVLRLSDLMRGILGEVSDVRVQLFDGPPWHIGERLYDSAPADASRSRASLFKTSVFLPMPGREWTLKVESLPVMEASVDRRTPRIIATEGAVISALALAIIWSLATLRTRAAGLAEEMTRELRESRERLGLAIEGSNQALFDWDVRTGRVTLSEQWSRITGTSANVTTVRELVALVHPEDRPHVLKQTRRLLRGRLPFYHTEHRVQTLAGGWRWISSRAKVVECDHDGRPTRVAGTNLDITERKEMERIKSEFIATVSHELRTPLTAVVGALGLLKREAAGKIPATAAMFLGMAQQNSDRLAALINDILDIEKIESGSIRLRMAAVPVARLLERAVSLNTPYASQFDVRLELRQPLPDAAVRGDEDRLLQVLTNLMSNAAKFSPAGTAVVVSCETTDHTVRIAVTDHGPGVPEEFRRRIFQKFAQADSKDTRQKGGTGLGLSICKAIVEKLGGTIGYQCEPGQGTTFYFDLPLRA